MRSIQSLNRYFGDAIKYGLLQIEQEGHYITVNVKETLDAQGGAWRWSLVCTVDMDEYTVIQAVNRITLMLAEGLRSSKQDVNIMYKEWQPKGRA